MQFDLPIPDLSEVTAQSAAIAAAIAWYSGVIAWMRLSGAGLRIARQANGSPFMEVAMAVILSPLIAMGKCLLRVGVGKFQPAEMAKEVKETPTTDAEWVKTVNDRLHALSTGAVDKNRQLATLRFDVTLAMQKANDAFDSASQQFNKFGEMSVRAIEASGGVMRLSKRVDDGLHSQEGAINDLLSRIGGVEKQLKTLNAMMDDLAKWQAKPVDDLITRVASIEKLNEDNAEIDNEWEEAFDTRLEKLESVGVAELVETTKRQTTALELLQKSVNELIAKQKPPTIGTVTIGTGVSAQTIPVTEWKRDPVARKPLPDGWNYASESQPPDGTGVELWWLLHGADTPPVFLVKGKWDNKNYHGVSWGMSCNDKERLAGTAWRLVKPKQEPKPEVLHGWTRWGSQKPPSDCHIELLYRMPGSAASKGSKYEMRGGELYADNYRQDSNDRPGEHDPWWWKLEPKAAWVRWSDQPPEEGRKVNLVGDHEMKADERETKPKSYFSEYVVTDTLRGKVKGLEAGVYLQYWWRYVA